MCISREIFRAYDIRGVIGRDLFPDIITRASAIFANIILETGGKNVTLAGDGRTSTDMLMSAAASGIVSGGCNVYITGKIPISVANFVTWRRKDMHGGAYITASHNPPEYNGIRFRHADGTGFAEENQEIKRRFFENEIKFANWDELGSIYTLNPELIIDEYLDFVSSLGFKAERKIKILIDTRNGIAGIIVPKLFTNLGFDVVPINVNVDGRFPAGDPDPVHADLSKTLEIVKTTHVSMAIAYDGDGDRAVMIDKKGRKFPAEAVAIVLAREILKPGDTIVYNVACSSMLREVLEEEGFKCVECRVGDVFVAKKLKATNAKFGVEGSYHFFPSWLGFYYDDAILVSAIFASLISRINKSLDELYDELKPWPMIKENISVSDEIKWVVIDYIKEKLLKMYDNVSTIDGIKIYFDGASVLIRPSNTEPKIRVFTEAKNPDTAMRLHKTFKKIVLDTISEVKQYR